MSTDDDLPTDAFLHRGSDTARPELPDQFARFRDAMLAVTEHAFELGQQNVCAAELFVQAKDGSYTVADDLRYSRPFEVELDMVLDFGTKFDNRLAALQMLYLMFEQDIETIASAESPSKSDDVDSTGVDSLVWRVAALENSLAEEKAWSEKLEGEREVLIAELARRNVPNPLTSEIREALANRNKP